MQTSDALGAAAMRVEPQVVALAASLNKQLGVSFGKARTTFPVVYSAESSAAISDTAVHANERAVR